MMKNCEKNGKRPKRTRISTLACRAMEWVECEVRYLFLSFCKFIFVPKMSFGKKSVYYALIKLLLYSVLSFTFIIVTLNVGLNKLKKPCPCHCLTCKWTGDTLSSFFFTFISHKCRFFKFV